MKFTEFIKSVITSHSGISSKRVCGVLGWLACIAVLIFCTVTNIQAPIMIDTVLWCCMGLLGIDSVTGAIKSHRYEDKKI